MRRRSRTCTACEHYASNTIEKPKAPNWRQGGAKQAVPPDARTSLPSLCTAAYSSLTRKPRRPGKLLSVDAVIGLAECAFEASWRRLVMANIDQREIAETVFRHNPKRNEVNEALKQEHARREAAVKNLYRLRALQLARDAKSNHGTQVP